MFALMQAGARAWGGHGGKGGAPSGAGPNAKAGGGDPSTPGAMAVPLGQEAVVWWTRAPGRKGAVCSGGVHWSLAEHTHCMLYGLEAPPSTCMAPGLGITRPGARGPVPALRAPARLHN